MGARLRARDWAATPLGPAGAWPAALKTLVAVMLGARQPMFVAWGPARTMLYNDDYATLCGARHPAALGQPFREVWFDILDDVEPILERAFAGEGTHFDDIPLLMHRNGYPEETHFSFSYTPVRDETGAVAGMFCACTETTGRVMAERAQEFRLWLWKRGCATWPSRARSWPPPPRRWPRISAATASAMPRSTPMGCISRSRASGAGPACRALPAASGWRITARR